ncbi:Uncharacterized protein PECH_003516 [Penicillium ucsense]|uniref:Rieske domain-containing protein n=1 Tax=Penicillium ucsense TaxID=2839758 RepID=A0A8J8W3C0_9EURO|nr:Uncharacterized protein PECM_007405 [Penicillium ucsense]KAF7737596.1 Uncharacterized protein PECH_003516 [Penicillium ucsense]
MAQSGTLIDEELSQARTQSATGRLPTSWYTSPALFQLERRAIFSRQWLLTTHSARFSKTGDWVRFDLAGFNLILIRDKDGTVNAFHNVCRHRAFPVVTEDRGTSRIFSCKYHGWSYGLNGKLAKAPGYQDLTGFDKSKNGLLSIHARTDPHGFIWVNLDGAETPELAWEEEAHGVDLAVQLHGAFNAEEYRFDHVLETTGEFNWKILAGSYDRATSGIRAGRTGDPLHRASGADPSLAAPLDAETKEDEEGENSLAAASFFPNASVMVLPSALLIERCVPIASTTTSMRFEVFRKDGATDEAIDQIDALLQRTLAEERRLFEATQTNLDASNSSSGGEPWETLLETSPLNFASQVRDLMTEFRHREASAGHEIWPSRQILPTDATTSRGDLDFCARLQAPGQTDGDCATLEPGCHGSAACQSANPALAY